MKTTVDLPDDLFVAAKKRAAEERCSLRDLVARGLRAALAPKRKTARPTPARIRWVTVDGGLPPGVDVRSREAMHDWIRRPR